MIKVIRYQANDGTLFVLEEQALARDEMQARIDSVLRELKEYPRNQSKGYVQQRASAVMACQELAVELSKLECPSGPWDSVPPHKVNPGLASRYLDNYYPVMRIWDRLHRIDSEFREWEQPYYIYHPEDATMVELPGV